jgi:hypothetical protein
MAIAGALVRQLNPGDRTRLIGRLALSPFVLFVAAGTPSGRGPPQVFNARTNKEHKLASMTDKDSYRAPLSVLEAVGRKAG